MRCMGCNGIGQVVEIDAGDWGWPYLCTYCDAEKLPDHLRHYTKRSDYSEGAEKYRRFARSGFFTRLWYAIRGAVV